MERGLTHGQGDGETLESLKESVERGDTSLWVAHDDDGVVAGMISRVVQHPAKRVVFVEMLAGREIKTWYNEGLTMLEKFRDINDATTIEASCRGGLAKFLEQRGWSRKAVIMESPK